MKHPPPYYHNNYALCILHYTTLHYTKLILFFFLHDHAQAYSYYHSHYHYYYNIFTFLLINCDLLDSTLYQLFPKLSIHIIHTILVLVLCLHSTPLHSTPIYLPYQAMLYIFTTLFSQKKNCFITSFILIVSLFLCLFVCLLVGLMILIV